MRDLLFPLRHVSGYFMVGAVRQDDRVRYWCYGLKPKRRSSSPDLKFCLASASSCLSEG